jgi:L-glutamine-phosphate cytidylyltransferase
MTRADKVDKVEKVEKVDKVDKAIIIAAGRGRRLMPYTDEMPKCLVPVDRRTILGIQVEAFRAHGVSDLVIIRGYLGDVLAARAHELGGGVRFVDNRDWEHNNILESLFCAEQEIDGPVLLTYSDIIFTPEVVGRLMAAPGDVCLIIDRAFRDVYEGRSDHPLPEAEVADLDERGLVRRVGKRALPPDQADGEFIGLAKLSAAGATWMRDAWRDLRAAYRGREGEPFQRAPSFRAAYLTDMLQHLIDAGHPVHPVAIDGEWREIDTVQDLERARAMLGSAKETWR